MGIETGLCGYRSDFDGVSMTGRRVNYVFRGRKTTVGVLVNRPRPYRNRRVKKAGVLRSLWDEEGHGAFLVEKGDVERRID